MALGVNSGEMQLKRAKKNPSDGRNVPVLCLYHTGSMWPIEVKHQISQRSIFTRSQSGEYLLIYLSNSQLRQLCLKFLEVMEFLGRMLL